LKLGGRIAIQGCKSGRRHAACSAFSVGGALRSSLDDGPDKPHNFQVPLARDGMADIIEKAEDYMGSASVSRDVLQDKLSECLAVERGGLKPYEHAIEIVSDPKVSDKFKTFRD
jgi:hypothetical protein